ncbi:hypothetical protein [Cloacibacillus evryensis]|uniref:hypothetical protein n=1 Tax=Cloacibacillus evryensis TaxID=508460 RepID=UPI00241D2E95|nr:hypothetical protein [Cloacibacillus evryensis]
MTTATEIEKSNTEEVTPIRLDFTEEQENIAFMKFRALAGEIVAIKRAIHPVKYCDGDDSPLAYSNFENKGYALAIEQLNNPLTNMIDEIIGTVSSAMESCGHSYNIDEWMFVKEDFKDCRTKIAELLSIREAAYTLIQRYEKNKAFQEQLEDISFLGIDLLSELYEKISNIYKDPDIVIVDVSMTKAYNALYGTEETPGLDN